MKKIIWVLILLFLLIIPVSCGDNAANEKENYSNGNFVCQIGNNLYIDLMNRHVLANGTEERFSGLCLDPLCTHNGNDSICMDHEMFSYRTIVTDGQKLYIFARDEIDFFKNPDMEKLDLRGIYSYDPVNGELKHLADAKSTSHFGDIIGCSDGFVYYTSAAHKQDENENIIRSDDSEYATLWRVPTNGGKAEQVTDEEYYGTRIFCVDKENIYMVRTAYDAEDADVLTVISLKNGKRSEVKLPCMRAERMSMYRGSLYLYLTEESNTVTIPECGNANVHSDRASIYSYRDGKIEEIIDGVGNYQISDGKIIYQKKSGIHYYGYYTDGGEKCPLWSDCEEGVSVYDIETRETEAWDCTGNFFPYGISQGAIIARRRTYIGNGEETEWKDEYVRLTKASDGTVASDEYAD